MRGARTDLAWKAPDFDAATRQLVGFELFRDDMSTLPPSRLTSALVPGQVLEARDLEVLPQSQYGVQPIWRVAQAGPPAAIEFGPPRLIRDLAGPAIFVPPEERIHSLAFLQRQGAITSEELESSWSLRWWRPSSWLVALCSISHLLPHPRLRRSPHHLQRPHRRQLRPPSWWIFAQS